MSMARFALPMAAFFLVSCGSQSRNPAVPKGPTDTIMRIESALAEVKADVYAKPYRGISDNMVMDHTDGLVAAGKGTPWEAEALAVHEAARKFAKSCLDRKSTQKKLQEEFAAIESLVQAIKEKAK